MVMPVLGSIAQTLNDFNLLDEPDLSSQHADSDQRKRQGVQQELSGECAQDCRAPVQVAYHCIFEKNLG